MLLRHADGTIARNGFTGGATGDREILEFRIVLHLDAITLVVRLDFLASRNKRISIQNLTTTDLDTLRVVGIGQTKVVDASLGAPTETEKVLKSLSVPEPRTVRST